MDETHPMCRIILAVLPDHFYDAHLHPLLQRRDRVIYAGYVLHRLRHRALREKHERVPFAGRVCLGNEKSMHELGGIRDKMLKFAIDGEDGEDSVFAHV